MAIASTAQLETALQCRFSRLYVSKTSVNAGNFAAGQNISYWYTSTGFPASGLAPTSTATALNHLSTGAVSFMQQTSPITSYLADLNAMINTQPQQTIEIHDRLIQISSTVSTTSQNVIGFDLSTFAGTNNISARKGDANYSDVQWWIENPAAGTNTAVNLTINVTYNDGTTGNLSIFTGYLNFRQARMFPLNNLIPAADSGKYIRGINSSISSVPLGNPTMAFVATRYRAGMFLDTINKKFNSGWTELGMPEIYNQSCLFAITVAPPASFQSLISLDGLIVHG